MHLFPTQMTFRDKQGILYQRFFSYTIASNACKNFIKIYHISAANCAIDVDLLFDMYQPDNLPCYTEANAVISVYSCKVYSMLLKQI